LWRRLRTAKSCGPDIPTLISGATRERCHPRRQPSPVSGASAKETVKTIARGMPGVSGVTVVTNARVYYHYTRGCGRTKRPAFPAPSDGRGRELDSKPRAQARRDCRTVAMDGAVPLAISVMPGRSRSKNGVASARLWPGIHVLCAETEEGVDGRVEPGHDGEIPSLSAMPVGNACPLLVLDPCQIRCSA
jgi:hypothetical protein